MAVQKPSIPKGTRDFSPEESAKRSYIFDTVKRQFQCFGYQPLETPAMENLSTLLGKYGDEGDKLLFKILNSGDYLSKIPQGDLTPESSSPLATRISEKGLRYDLTVPFARYVVMHQNEISFPFKRYQIQPVWRADRPQKGRYREFYQCDVDVIGSTSLLNEVELLQIIDTVFEKLKIKVVIKLNNRKILSGIAEYLNASERLTDITVAIDKIDKIGLNAVKDELIERGVSADSVGKLEPILLLEGKNQDKLNTLRKILASSETGIKGIEELETILAYAESLSLSTPIEIDLSLARGLNYYTGAIIEVKAKDVAIGSICGGGRYDDLTGIFGLNNMSGVGISFGADRIYDVMAQLDIFPAESAATSKVMFVNFGEKEAQTCLGLLALVRKAGIAAELYPDSAKMKKQLDYANRKGIPFVALIGENEIATSTMAVKSMASGEQHQVAFHQLNDFLTNQ
ncbi:histidine--tRNA ligase [Williamwhitmania taraxaci]|uniref:Histidine--tRNA ligase n=1 Tax=Williamwhitmania taraxaci TaxID=1640674 RepID=A0A1G6HM19_9BACT|nr:histidine--tRNA ligase [Williamwhitmania taraxaci]SDB95300.1 histidyl-tRNA synthetase [Williamwhitmania taraxaci]